MSRDLVAEIKSCHSIESVLASNGVKVVNNKFCCPFHPDVNPSGSIYDSGTKVQCFAGCFSGDVIELLAKYRDQTSQEYLKEASKKLSENFIEYSYQDEGGDELYQAIRKIPKNFLMRRVVNGEWVWNLKGVKRVLYRLPRISNAPQVWFCEGEKDVHTLESCGIVATTSICGAGDASKWQSRGYTANLKGKDVVLCGDNDESGEQLMQAVSVALLPVAKSVRRVRVPEPYKDVSDWVASRGLDEVSLKLGEHLLEAPILRTSSPKTMEIVENLPNPTNLPGVLTERISEAVYPSDSILEDWMIYARDLSEANDSTLIACILPVTASLLARRVYVPFAQKKYCNLFNMVVARAGDRKSSTVHIADEIATALLTMDSFVWGICSDQALFKTYQANPDKLWIISDGNPLLNNWAHDNAGRQVAKRMLDLYDCQRWNQNYIKQELENGKANEIIPETSTSFLIATTFNSARFNGLEIKDGLRRRTSYYVSEGQGRIIYWPKENCAGKEALILALRFLQALSGPMILSPDSLNIWREIQDYNRYQISQAHGYDAASEALGMSLSESPSKILKLAMIFEICRYLKDSSRDWRIIQPDTLQIAANHQDFCIYSSKVLDTIGQRAEIAAEADILLAKIIIDFKHKRKGDWIHLSKSEITAKFAPHSCRPGQLTPDRIYLKIIPDLIKRKLAKQISKDGRLEIFGFFVDEPSAG